MDDLGTSYLHSTAVSLLQAHPHCKEVFFFFSQALFTGLMSPHALPRLFLSGN